jgi:hypothetical protein
MDRRLQLQNLLEETLGSNAVYFQPPANVQMEFPCITYSRDSTDTRFADNRPYRHIRRYDLTVIDRDPDTAIPDRVAELPMCLHARTFVANNLNHYVFTLYF